MVKMQESAICFCFIVLIASTFARIAVTDTVLEHISNEIDKDVAVNYTVETTTKAITNHVNEESPNTDKPSQVLNEIANNQTENLDLNVTSNTAKNSCENQTEDISNNLIPTDDEPSCDSKVKEENDILRLTTYIEEDRIEEGRKAAEVNPGLFLGFKSYSGYFTVNKTYDSNIFFWYFPVEKKLVNETPWIIWLQGGPGASSMSGLFDEIGPFRLNHKKLLVRNPHSWLQNHSLLFIDNPVGTGSSFTNHEDGYATDMATYTNHLYSTLQQFLQVFPELRTAPLFIAGESYAGKYVPALGMEIHKHKNTPGGEVNLTGLMIGNAYVEPGMILQITDSFFHFGLLVQEQLDIVKPLLDKFHDDIANNRSVKAKERWNAIVALLLFLSNQKQAYNFLRDEMPAGKYEWFLRLPEVKKALHIGNIHHSFVNITVNKKLAPEFLSNTRPLFESLLNEYRVLAYCGQLDQMLPCAATSQYYRKWKWDNSDEFLNATRYPLIFNNKPVGYHKSGGGLTEVLVRGAGHMAPLDAPATTHEMVTRWTHGRALTRPLQPDLQDMLEFLKKSTENLEMLQTEVFL